MKPAVCCLCGKSALDDNSNENGDWVEFKNYQEQDSSNLSHPVGLEYFCSEHLSEALNLSKINSNEALDELKLNFPCKDSNIKNESHKMTWWKRFIN